MGITWIYEDSQEAIYSNTEEVPPPGGSAPTHFICPFCVSSFSDFPAMQRHASSEHPLQRPALLWNGYEVSVDRKIISRGAFAVTNCTSAFIAIDGAAEHPIPPNELPGVLNLAVESLFRVRLENQQDKKMAPAISAYRLEFRIADQSSLSRVEEAFHQHIILSAPTPDAIRIFLEDPRCTGVASEYAAGLYAYLHALLLKERLSDSGLFSGYATHSDRFGEALQKLEQVDRKLALMICAIVRLMRNDISGDVIGCSPGPIAIAGSMLRGPRKTTPMKRHPSSIKSERLCPVDHGTSRSLLWLTDWLPQSAGASFWRRNVGHLRLAMFCPSMIGERCSHIGP
ncbi:hypothetical protein LZK75_09575 [Rhizobium leguminosarum]|nr:hypothetical protein LZK75_09575 [Rhizobium leguminosarum]